MTYRSLKKITYLGLIILDFIGILFSFYLAYTLRSHLPQESYYLPARPYLILSIMLGILYVLILHGAETQKKHPFESYPVEAWAITNSILKGTIIFMAISFLYRGFSISRLIVIFHLLLAIIIVAIVRLIWRLAVIKPSMQSKAKRRILALSSSSQKASQHENSEMISRHSEEKRKFIFNADDLNSFEKLEEEIVNNQVDCLELNEKDFNADFLLNIALLSSRLRIDLRVRPDLISLIPLKFTLEESGGELYWTAGKGLRELYPRTLKRIFDFSFALFLFLVFLIPGIFISLVIAFSNSGGVFYSHERIGVGGRKFRVLKFRTMYADADERLKKNPELYSDFMKGFKLKIDPRVTPIGRFLRRTSLDELPQIINILKGEMSFVGPRPVVEEELSRYGRYKDLLMSVPPGLTGLWQVSGRSDLTYEERVRLDLYYVENWTLGFDMIIIARTLPVFLFGKGAY